MQIETCPVDRPGWHTVTGRRFVELDFQNLEMIGPSRVVPTYDRFDVQRGVLEIRMDQAQAGPLTFFRQLYRDQRFPADVICIPRIGHLAGRLELDEPATEHAVPLRRRSREELEVLPHAAAEIVPHEPACEQIRIFQVAPDSLPGSIEGEFLSHDSHGSFPSSIIDLSASSRDSQNLS